MKKLTPEWAFRLSLAIIYVWFGLLKLPDLSPAAALVEEVVFWWDMSWFLPTLGVGEALIGLSFLWPRLTRISVVLVLLHMVGASVIPFFTATEQLLSTSFYGWTLEGQYVVKNLLIVSAAYYLWSSLRHTKRPYL